MPRSSALPFVLALALLASCSDAPTSPDLAPTAPDPARAPAARSPLVHDQESLQAALDAPLPARAQRVVVLGSDIALTSPVAYSGAQDLRLEGRGNTIRGPEGDHAILVTGGADLSLHRLTVEDAGGHGVLVEVPAAASGTVEVSLHDVDLLGNGLSGLWIEDQVNASRAGVSLVIRGSRIEGNGFRPGAEFADFDGVRVNEGGAGDLRLVMHDNVVTGNAADGVELDETGAGDVHSLVHDTRFDDNGDQPQNPDDLEDGFDIDEAGDGGIHTSFARVSANGNEDEGIDLDEEGTGDLRATLLLVEASGNLDAGISFTEDELGEAGGDVEFAFTAVNASDSRDGDGINVEEFGDGDVRGVILASRVERNADDGIQVEQGGEGTGTLRLQRVTLEGNADDAVNTDGVEVERR